MSPSPTTGSCSTMPSTSTITTLAITSMTNYSTLEVGDLIIADNVIDGVNDDDGIDVMLIIVHTLEMTLP